MTSPWIDLEAPFREAVIRMCTSPSFETAGWNESQATKSRRDLWIIIRDLYLPDFSSRDLETSEDCKHLSHLRGLFRLEDKGPSMIESQWHS